MDLGSDKEILEQSMLGLRDPSPDIRYLDNVNPTPPDLEILYFRELRSDLEKDKGNYYAALIAKKNW